MVGALAATLTLSACSGSTGVAAAPAAVHIRSVAPVPSAPSAHRIVPALTKSTPVRLRIPQIGVDSALMRLGLLSDGSLQVPPSGFPAGWYTGGPTPGQLGPAVIAGHVDWHGPGVFLRLHELRPGALIVVNRADGSQLTFRVSRVATFPKDRFPTASVYGDLDHAGLRLITCGGSFDSRTGHYRDNIVVFGDLTGSTS